MSELAEFFRKKSEEDEKQKVDWENEKQEWLETIETFNKQIIDWLKEPIKEKLVTSHTEELNISEYLMGNYQAPSLVITSGKEIVSFKPIGKLVLGFNGRIDMASFTETKTLVYIKDKQSWFLFEQSKKENLKLFDEKLFTELLKKMLS